MTLKRVTSYVIKNHAHIPLSTSSGKKKLIHKSAETSTSFTYEQLFRLQADLGLSTRQTRVHAHDLRVATSSRKAVGHKFKQRLTKNSHTVDDCFKELKINYLRVDKHTKVSEHFKQSNIVANLLILLCKRDYCKTVNPCSLKWELMMGWLCHIVCLSIFDIDNLVSGNKVDLLEKLKESGVKKIFLSIRYLSELLKCKETMALKILIGGSQ